ncbi:MAG TPA: single-stranded DNA-binding protein [Bacillota bacterium]|jgi:single-strand DNA-binding protein|nr:single-stranded DNA-binding protein [Bacillota bacterium]HOJ83261.1 single-stranded DNA-binding protein [Bacillota bacterium]HOL15144.1 single-stranded DNA-binding protein [Bacillota bacterium]HPZ11366.1 single-stranded DNA-binding protein [Bacillota bacterium]HQE09388.1 single-stranded DNA-binding protein [Bacillota bacterium]
MLNLVVLIGRLTHDPELRYTPGNGTAVATFSLAVNRPFANRQGEREADFIRIVTWDKLAENCANYLRKGSLAAVTGRLQIRSYDDREGIRRKAAEVVARDVRFLERPRTEESESDLFPGDDMAVSEDDIPF